MYYVNFDDHITAPFGLVIDAWPLEKFAAPGSFSSLPVLTILHNAWQSGATRFRSLSDEEWAAWNQARAEGTATSAAVTLAADAVPVEADSSAASGVDAEGAGAGAGADSVATGSNNTEGAATPFATALTPSATAVTPPAPVAGQKRPLIEFFNAVAVPNGSGLQVSKKVCKERSDKGKTRGPRKKSHAGSENTPPTVS